MATGRDDENYAFKMIVSGVVTKERDPEVVCTSPAKERDFRHRSVYDFRLKSCHFLESWFIHQ